jgi:hypothetical protein
VDLEAVRWIAAEHTGLQDGAEVHASAARHGRIDDFNIRVCLRIESDQRF